MSKGSKRRIGNTEAFDRNYDRIFSGKRESGTFVIKDGKAVKVERTEPGAGIHIIGDMEAFKSPIDGEVITTRSQLADHNKRHGVTNSADYSKEYFAKKHAQRTEAINGNTKADKADRIERLKWATDKHR